ncbi:Uncharacterised protein [Mycobacteroides abscessus subsp. abscessus]|nr:Uncharacterised protein [Mycobacteroides abscessus subsp. abscessus]
MALSTLSSRVLQLRSPSLMKPSTPVDSPRETSGTQAIATFGIPEDLRMVSW